MKTRKKWFVLIGILFAGATLYGCARAYTEKSLGASAQQEAPVQEEGEVALQSEATSSNALFGTFDTVTLEGNPANQDIFASGKLTMVKVWATYCGSCIREMPDLAEIAEEYQDKMQIVGIISNLSQPNDATALEIIEKTGASYTHLVNSQELYSNYLNQVYLVPTTVFVDGEGKQVGEVYQGSKSKAAWLEIIDEVLAKMEG